MLTPLIIGVISGWIAGRIMGVKKGGFIKIIAIESQAPSLEAGLRR